MLALALATSDLGALSVAVLERFQLTHPKYNVLRMLAGAGDRGLTHSEITQWMVTGVPDVTRLVDGLERRKLARRERDRSDRRRVRHYMEPAGLTLLANVQPAMAAVYDWVELAITHIENFLTTGNDAPMNWSFAAVGANLIIPTAVLALVFAYSRSGGSTTTGDGEPTIPR